MRFIVEFDIAGEFYAFGRPWPDVESAMEFVGRYDPDGTIRMRIIEEETGREISNDSYRDAFATLQAMDIQARNRRRIASIEQPSEKVDWINQGF